MPYSAKMLNNHLYSVFFAPRGRDRIYDLGIQIAQMYLSPFDKLIGIIGESGSGKSMLIKGMFPGLELTNDDGGVNTAFRCRSSIRTATAAFLPRIPIIWTSASRLRLRRCMSLQMQFCMPCRKGSALLLNIST